ncbi:replication protein [Paenibacillus dokdonensis]|uniref:Replication protein n=1 Tax=Paenibacillus dokdonensis TaxID=2567944 RepID=A0ABU6GI88_9BACL|nr:replication protein [Paenibacillus dokdonensis]MEC0239460.1 replication protein [Paenibacillus dokdonensis]
MAGPQLEDGYTRIANAIIEEVARRKLNGTQYSILLTVWRYTYGFNRKDCALSVSFIKEAIDGDLKGVKKELGNLIDRRILVITKEAHGIQPRRIAFNKRFEEWGVVVKSPPLPKKPSGGQMTPRVVDNSPPVVGVNRPPKKERKKTLKKEDIYMDKLKFHDTVYLTLEQYEKLCSEFGKHRVDNTIEALDEWQTNKKPSQHKKDHNKTIRVWIKKDMEKSKTFKTKQQRNQEEQDILNQFYEEGAARETNGDGKLPGDDQNRLSLL